MADLQNLYEVSNWFGNDLTASDTGDLDTVMKVTRSRQRVFRRLMTNPGNYLSHSDYGGGLPQQIGLNTESAKIKARIKNQMKLEASVNHSSDYAPTVSLTQNQNMISASISYYTATAPDPAVLSFKLSE